MMILNTVNPPYKDSTHKDVRAVRTEISTTGFFVCKLRMFGLLGASLGFEKYLAGSPYREFQFDLLYSWIAA